MDWNAEDYARHAAFVPRLADDVLDLLQPQSHERILDLGCGDGTLSWKLAQCGCQLDCIDASPQMVEAARAKGLNAKLLDGQHLNLPQRYDAVFSNAALHWMTQPQSVARGVWHALKPGGRFVGEFGGQGNIQPLVIAMEQAFLAHPEWGPFHNPWYFPDAESYRALLQDIGFEVSSCQLVTRPTHIEGSIRDWLQVFSSGITANLDGDQIETFNQQVEQHLLSEVNTHHNGLILDYVRLRFVAIRPKSSV